MFFGKCTCVKMGVIITLYVDAPSFDDDPPIFNYNHIEVDDEREKPFGGQEKEFWIRC